MRPAVLAAGARPTARVVLRTPALAVAVLAAGPAVATALLGERDFHVALTAAGLVGSCALGFALDDPAGPTLGASPTPARSRRLMLMAPTAAAVAVAWLVAAWAATGTGFPLAPLGPRVAEAAAAGGLALTAAHLLSARGEPAPGLAAAVGTVMLLTLGSLASSRWDWLPVLGRPDDAGRWWALAAGAWAAAAWLSRDPAAGRVARRRPWRRAPLAAPPPAPPAGPTDPAARARAAGR